jgi:prepilin-type processing-associated H-X9-DG protein
MKRKPQTTGSHLIAANTLIELLVVIAIIAILAAMLLPALSRSKDEAQKTVCTGNLKQMGLTLNMYCDDNSAFMPYCGWDGGDAADPYPGWLYTLPIPKGLPDAGQTVIPDPFKSPWTVNGSGALGATAWASGAYFPYMKVPTAYLCPKDTLNTDWTAEPQGANGPGRNNKLSTYVMNGATCNYGNTTAPIKITTVWSPMCYLQWEPNEQLEKLLGNSPAFEYNDSGNSPNAPPSGAEGIGNLHNGAGNALALDGHVDVLGKLVFERISDFEGAGPQGRGLLWWAPSVTAGGWTPSMEPPGGRLPE